MMNSYPNDISVKDAILLTNIYKQFNSFCMDCKKLSSLYVRRDIIDALWRLSNGESVFCMSDLKKFYNKYKVFLDTINMNTDFRIFLSHIFYMNGEYRKDCPYKFYCDYMIKNESNIDKIKELLNKINNIGILDIELIESEKFHGYEYQVSDFDCLTTTINYFENMEFIPNYLNKIKYKSLDSNYKISFPYSFGVICDVNRFSRHDSKITVNNLLFDSNKLPDAFSKDLLFDELVKKSKLANSSISRIIDSVNLGVTIDDLNNQLAKTGQIIDNLDNIKNKDKLKLILEEIKLQIIKLSELSSQYDKDIIDEDSSLNEKLLDEEKKAYVKRREWSKFDID